MEWDIVEIPTATPTFSTVGISTISYSVSEKHSTSGLESAILNYGGRLTSDKVGSFAVDSGMVENVGEAVVISTISHSVPEKHSTSGLESSILKHVVGWRRAMSDNVGSVTIDPGIVENVGVAVGISMISHSVPDKHSRVTCYCVNANYLRFADWRVGLRTAATLGLFSGTRPKGLSGSVQTKLVPLNHNHALTFVLRFFCGIFRLFFFLSTLTYTASDDANWTQCNVCFINN